MNYDVLVIGGGAGGFFTAIQLNERTPQLRVAILEQSKQVLSKVKISGGGRCNVTNSIFSPRDMVANYPRGGKELLGPFHQFCCGDTMGWFAENGVETKIEEDGRTFPISDSSQTIIDLFLRKCRKGNVDIKLQYKVLSVSKRKECFVVVTNQGELTAAQLVVAPGSSAFVWKLLAGLGHEIVAPVPSLFTFNIQHALLKGMMGLSFQYAHVRLPKIKHEQVGPLLITHWGLSGPAVLKTSAYAAREMHRMSYQVAVEINWVGESYENVYEQLKQARMQHTQKAMFAYCPIEVPKRFWQNLLTYTSIQQSKNWADASNRELKSIATLLTKSEFKTNGKTTFKEEFVTAGGVNTKEVNFKTMESKKLPGMYFVGEVLNIDGITGGFNFQAAWTEGFLAAKAIASR